MSKQTKPKSPNVKLIESMVTSNCIIDIDQKHTYFIQNPLGYGHFGITYKARSLQDGSLVAAKIQAVDRASSEADVFRKVQLIESCDQIVDFYRFGQITSIKSASGSVNSNPVFEYHTISLSEVKDSPAMLRALALLKSGNAEAWDMLSESGAIVKKHKALGCIVMELVNGTPIREMPGSCDPEKAVSITVQICRAIQHMHKWYFIHGDLKPGNVMITQEGKVKVLDFSTSLKEGAPNPTVAMSFYAPTHYQKRQKGVERYSDLYSIACILYHLMTGKEPITTYSYSYQSSQYQPKVHARVKKYFEKISNIPDELREPICQVIGDEISSIADYVTSERELRGRMKDLPISQSSKIPVIDFLSSDLSTNESSRHFSMKAKELGKALEDGYTYYRRRKFREQLAGTIERSVNIGVAFIGIVFVIAVAISALTSLNKPSGELPPMTRVSDVEMQYTDDEFDSEESEQHIEATQTAEAITSQITQASQHFSNAVDLHEQAETLTNTQESAIVYQEALDEYSDALTIFLAVLDDAEGSSAEYRGALCKVIYATTWNMSLVYEDVGRMQECLLHLEKAGSYLKEGYELYPEETDDLPDLTRTYEKLGDLHLEQGAIDDSLDAYQKCISYLINPSMPIEDSWFIVVQLESKIRGIMDRPNLTATQESRAQELLVSLDEVGKGSDNE